MAVARALVLLALLVGGLAIGGYGWTMYQNQQSDVHQAVEVQGTVEIAGVQQFGSERNVEYEAAVKYTYTYEGKQYTSESVYPGAERQFNLREDARAVADRFSPGETTTVYVNQEDPSRSFLVAEKRYFEPLIFTGIGGLLAVVGAYSLGVEFFGGSSDD